VQVDEHADLRISMPEMQGTLLCRPDNVRVCTGQGYLPGLSWTQSEPDVFRVLHENPQEELTASLEVGGNALL
jgi:hypothetical protein